MSEISSSLRATWLPSPLPETGKFTAGPPGTAEAVPASDKDKPAAPNTGKALLPRFRFEGFFDMGFPPKLGRY
jgi:hypothetical protein